MARVTNQQLQELVDRLQADNDTLRSALDAASRSESADALGHDKAAAASHPGRRRRSWAWTLLATVLIVIGAILAPVAVAANWAKAELGDTDTFVATFAPLAHDKSVQAYVTDQVVGAIDQQVDIRALTSDVFDSIADLGLGPTATKALQALKAPAALGIQSLIHGVVSDFVSSKQFATIWEQTLRTTHSQLVATMQNDKNAAVAIGTNGEIGVQLGPIITQAKTLLVNQGVTFAENIPVINKTIVVAQSDAIGLVQVAYGLTMALGSWLPWAVLVLLAAGVLVATRRSLALVWSAVALGLGMVLLLVALAIGRVVFVASVSPSIMPMQVATNLFDQLMAFMQSAAVAVAVLAITVAVVAWLAGPFRLPRRLRELGASGAASLRAVGDRHGLSTRRVGTWLHQQRVLVRVAIAVIGAVIILFVRPLTPGLIIWTAVLCVLVIGVLALLERPTEDAVR